MKFLFVLHEMGTLDHAVSLKRQLEKAGASVTHVILGQNNRLPPWAETDFKARDSIEPAIALLSQSKFAGVWFQSPFDEHRPIEWSQTAGLKNRMYSGYGISLSNWFVGNYELDFFHRLGLIVASSPFAAQMFKHAGAATGTVQWFGDPLLYRLSQIDHSSQSPVPTILWAPHWTDIWVDGTRGFSRWRETVGPLYSYFSSNSSARLIVRGHPFLHIGEASDSPEAKRFTELLRLDNVEMSTQSLVADIEEASALITDGVSILVYFGITGKPMSVVQSGADTAPFNAAGRAIVCASQRLNSGLEISAWLKSIFEKPELLGGGGAYTRELISQLFPLQEASPGEKAIEYIKKNPLKKRLLKS